MEELLVKDFRISVTNFSKGVQTIVLKFDDISISIDAIFVKKRAFSEFGGQPLSTLIEKVKFLSREVNPEDNIAFMATETEWCLNPGAFKLRFMKFFPSNILNLDICRHHYDISKRNTDFYRKQPEYSEERWSFQLPFEVFKQSVIHASLSLLKEYGYKGINSHWCDYAETFPLGTLMDVIGCNAQSEKSSKTDVFKEFEHLLMTLREV